MSSLAPVDKTPSIEGNLPLARTYAGREVAAVASASIHSPAFANMCATGNHRNVLDSITAMSGEISLTRVCRTFRNSVQQGTSPQGVLPREWARFPMQNYPHIQLMSRTLGLPRNVADVQRYYDTAYAMALSFGHADYVQLTANFSPASVVVSLENALRRAENDYNLLRIGPKIHAALITVGVHAAVPTTANEVRALLTTHAAAVANLWVLDLSDLGLTAIPEELAALPLAQLIHLSLHNNQLTSLPANFLTAAPLLQNLELQNNRLTSLPANFLTAAPLLQNLELQNNRLTSLPANFLAAAPNLKYLSLYTNQLTSLPENFLAAAPQLRTLYLSSNKLTSLQHFPIAVPQLQDLYLYENQLASLPANFLTAAPQLQSLYLYDNQLTSLPAGFGNAWPWWLGERNAILAGNPILLSRCERISRSARSLVLKHIDKIAIMALGTALVSAPVGATVTALYSGFRYLRKR